MDTQERLIIRRFALLCFCLMVFCLTKAQNKKIDYQPISQQEQNEIGNTLFTNNVESFFATNGLALGPVTVTNILNMVSYNPIEGTRIRLSMKTNDKFSKRAMISALAAYGTKDKRFKYALSTAYNFNPKAKGVYSYPASTLSLSYENNTYMPSYSNYDVSYCSFGNWDRFYFARKKQATLSFTQDISKVLSFQPYILWQQIDSYILYDADRYEQSDHIYEQLDGEHDYINKQIGAEISFHPSQKNKLKEVFKSINSRFYSFETQAKLSYSYTMQEYIDNHEFSKVELLAQHRINLKPMALDLRFIGGKIFGSSDRCMYFSANYMVSAISNYYGFNLYAPYEVLYKEYLQTYVQLNFGGILLDNINYFKKLRSNEFINFKALITDNDPYFEVGAGVDHILGFLGIEVIRRICESNPFDMPQWGFRIRCTL